MKTKIGDRIQGWDISLGHGAMIELTNGKLSNHWIISDHQFTKRIKKQFPIQVGKILSPPVAPKRDKDQGCFSAERLDWWYSFLEAHVKATRPTFVAIEDYAYGAAHRAHQIGEVGGAARRLLWHYRIPFRLHDPLSVKMFATGKGDAKKLDMIRGVEARWDISFRTAYPDLAFMENVEDLADATTVSQLLHLELQLRRGIVRLQDLPEKDIQIFNRTTKTYPTNILGRNFIVKKQEKKEDT